jgi:carbon-monoxide dehydrogenase iron sulfur subunit
MKTVIVRPERCVGCLQCRLNCAVEHSRSKSLVGALGEAVRPKPRLRIFPAGLHLSFPNKCRHCRPAPCLEVCIAGAIHYDEARGVVDIDFQRCISCAMCAMACPFGVLVYAPVHAAPDHKAVALKCDQCPDREQAGRVPACVEACKVGALTYGEWQEEQAAKGQGLARAFFAAGKGEPQAAPAPPAGIRLWRQLG